MPEYRDVFRGIILSDPAAVFTERYVQHPMQTVYDGPAASNRTGEWLGITVYAADITGRFAFGSVFKLPFAFNHADRSQTFPVLHDNQTTIL